MLEDWQLLEPIAQGGTSRLFRARHLPSGRLAAVKFFDGESKLNLHPLLARSLEQEACLLKELKQENIVEFLEWGISPRGLYLALEYLPGVSLAQLIERRLKAKAAAGNAARFKSCLGHAELLVVVEQICLALKYLHKRGIVHGDLKPANVIVIPKSKSAGERHLVKLVDFGIAKWTDAGSKKTEVGKSERDIVFGSPLYMSPEQCLGLKVDGRCDIYALGCLMYECLLGRQPLCGQDAKETMFKHVHEPVDFLALARLGSPLAPIVKKCLAKKRENRYQDVGEILELLSRMKPLGRKRNFKISGKK